MDLSRFCAAPGARLSHLSFEGDRAFLAKGNLAENSNYKRRRF
jgi:hypothetical protein